MQLVCWFCHCKNRGNVEMQWSAEKPFFLSIILLLWRLLFLLGVLAHVSAHLHSRKQNLLSSFAICRISTKDLKISPIVYHQLRALSEVGVKQVILAVSYMPQQMVDAIPEIKEKVGIKRSMWYIVWNRDYYLCWRYPDGNWYRTDKLGE